MRIFIWTMFVINILGVFARAVFIATKTYPRTIEFGRGEDMMYLFIAMGMVIWAAWLLFAIG